MNQPPGPGGGGQKPIRVMIVDDSAVIRTVISRTLRAQSDMEVAGVAVNGEIAVKSVKQMDPDIVILDIEMPVMDGLTTLPLLLKEKPGLRVLICSTLSARGADVSVRALSLGAADCILKPGGDAIISASEFQDNLVKLVRQLAPASKKAAAPAKPAPALRKQSIMLPPRVIAIGCSTGGPRVLMDFLPHLKGLSVPIVITQHMPKTFTAMLAQHITQGCGIPCAEGAEGMQVLPGHAYVAPGGYHMTLRKADGAVAPTIHLNEEPPENFCRPSVNPMLRSLSPIYGNAILAIILTGMGADGSQACAELVSHGGHVIAQDEASSTVWGMPGAVATAGICSAVLPPDGLANCVHRALKGAAL